MGPSIVVSPSAERIVASAAVAGVGDVDRAVVTARQACAFGRWPRMSARERASISVRMVDGIASHELIRVHSSERVMAEGDRER